MSYCRVCLSVPCDCAEVTLSVGTPPRKATYRTAPLRVPVEPAEVPVVPAVEPHDARLAWVRARALEALHGAAIGLAVGAAVGVLLAVLRRVVP